MHKHTSKQQYKQVSLIVSRTLINKPINELRVIRTIMQCYKMSVLEKQNKKKTKHQTKLQFLFSTTLNACVKLGNMSSTPDSPSKPIPDIFFHLISQGRCVLILMSNGLLSVSLSGSALRASEQSEPNPGPTANTWSPTRSRKEQIVWYVSRERMRERPLPVMCPYEAVLVMDLQLSCAS